jgi:hypothetical protein
LPHYAFALQTRQNHGLQSFCPTAFTLSIASAKICYALPTLKASIVLSDFARSLSAE